MSLHIPIGLNEGIDYVSTIHTEPPVILPRMLVAEMHRNDEPAAAFTSHMPLAISLNILSLEAEACTLRASIIERSGPLRRTRRTDLTYANVMNMIV